MAPAAADAFAGMERLQRLAREFSAGRILLLIDDASAVGSCELVVAGPHASAAAINFMTRFGGVPRLAITQARAERLRLRPMVHRQRAGCETYTVSIEAARGVTTGISAHDRALTVRTALEALDDLALVSPGHVFPVITAERGVRDRVAVAEAAVELMSLTSPDGSALLSKVLQEDGQCLPTPRGEFFALQHGLLPVRLSELVNALMAVQGNVDARGTSRCPI